MAESLGERWRLYLGDQLVADLVVVGGDFPWLSARIEPRDGFEKVRPLFAEELRLLDNVDRDVESWEAAYAAVRSAVILRYPDGHPVPEFVLHIDGEDAWWRWNDEPFDDE
jgi:hypothetical protein